MELTIRFDQRKKEVKALLEYLKSLPYIEVDSHNARYNAETEKAIQEVKNKKASPVSLENFRKQLYI